MEFTYSFSEEKLVVTDLQGCYDEATNTYRLTDPVLLTKNKALFGCTNMRSFLSEIKNFFKKIDCLANFLVVNEVSIGVYIPAENTRR